MHKINFKIANVIIELLTDSSDFIGFCKHNFEHHLTEQNGNKVDLRVEFYEYRKAPKNNANFINYVNISKNVKTNFKEIVAIEPEYTLNISYDNKMKIIANYSKKISLMRFLRKKRIGISIFKPDYFMIFRKIVLFPTFYLLEKSKNSVVVHAAAYMYKGKTVLLPGLANVGKSATSLSATFSAGGKLLGDNYIILQGNKMYGVIESIRLDQDGLFKKELQERKPFLVRNKRSYFKLKNEEIISESQVDIIGIPSLGHKFEVKTMSTDKAIDFVMQSTLFVNELHYTDVVSLSDYIYPNTESSTFKSKLKIIENTVKENKTVELVISKKTSPLNNVEKIYEI